MEKRVHDSAPVKSATSARQGETSGHMRWVLLASMILVIAALGYAVFGMDYWHYTNPR